MKATAFIPVKQHSTRIPKKNIIDLGGQPLILWTIEACKRWPVIDHIHIATDDYEIIDMVKDMNVTITALNSSQANDHHTTAALLWKQLSQHTQGTQILMHATDPFRTLQELQTAWDLYLQGNYDLIMSAVKDSRYILVNGKPDVDLFSPSALTQNYPPRHVGMGNFIISKMPYQKENYQRACAFPISKLGGIDIDDEEDLFIARAIAEVIVKDPNNPHNVFTWPQS